MIAVADHDEVVISILGESHDYLGCMASPASAADGDAKSSGHVLNFALALLKVVARGLGFAFRLAGQVSVSRQRLPHPEGSDFCFGFAGQRRGAFERGLSAL